MGRVLSVCEVLQSLPYYHGKQLKVRGVYWYGLRDDCAKPLVSAGRVWPPALDLAGPASASAQLERRTADGVDASWDVVERAAKAQAKTGKPAAVWVVAEGVLEAGTSASHPLGDQIGGYGHLGVFPAQLVITKFSDVAIQASPAYDYRVLYSGAQ